MTDGELPEDNDGGLVQSREDGQLHFASGTEDRTFPVMAPENASPLEEDEPEGVIPKSPLLAMKERRHEQFHLFGHPDRIRVCLGSGDEAVYVMDDGKRHCTLGRKVGTTRDGCVYSLTARVTVETYRELTAGYIDARAAFVAASEAALSGTVEAPGLSDVFAVEYYAQGGDIPGAYLPPAPFIEFAEDLRTAGD